MAKKKNATLKRKSESNFGSANYDSTNLPLDTINRTGFQIRLGLEEGLKLQLSLQQALWELNRLDRRSKQNRETGVTMVIFPHQQRIMVTHETLKRSSTVKKKT